MELNLDGVIRSSDIKLRQGAEDRINLASEDVEPLMQKWAKANTKERTIIEYKLATIGSKLIKIYAVNTRSILRK
jgi:hypothetical protein